MEKEELKKEFPVGVMWEDNPWHIVYNCECSKYGGEPCPHCHSFRREKNVRRDGSVYFVEKWICPRVVVVSNEAGYNSTGLCIDCLLEAINKE